MKTLIVTGSPKREGHCFELTRIALDAALKAGAEAEVLRVHDYKLQPCHMCRDGWGPCREEHVCSFGADGLNEIQAKIAGADNYVFITPVYWWETSDAMKLFLDRVRRCEASKNFSEDKSVKSAFAGKPCIMVASAGGSGNGVIGAMEQMDRFMRHVGGMFYDHISMNRWTFDYKKNVVAEAVTAMITKGGGGYRA